MARRGFTDDISRVIDKHLYRACDAQDVEALTEMSTRLCTALAHVVATGTQGNRDGVRDMLKILLPTIEPTALAICRMIEVDNGVGEARH